MHLVSNSCPLQNVVDQPQTSISESSIPESDGLKTFSQEQQLTSVWISDHKTIKIRAVATEYYQALQVKPLSHREMEVLRLIVEGDTNAEIAKKLYLTAGTVKSHVRNIFAKLGVRDRTVAAVVALRAGLVD